MFGVVHEHRTTHRRIQAEFTWELAPFNAPVIDADSHAYNRRRIVHYAIAHEGVCRLFFAGTLRHVHRNLDAGITALRRLGVGISRRPNLREGLELLLGILGRDPLVRQQVRTASVVVRILPKRILERLADTQDTVGLDKRKTELVVTQGVATPEVRDAVFQRLAQVPFVHFPYGDTACRDARIVAVHAHNQALRLLGVDLALALRIAGAVLENLA